VQAFRSFNYVRDQAVKARIVRDYRDYPHTRIDRDQDVEIARATARNAFPREVPYQRYEK
jgi:hypothetical protein